MRGCWFEKFNDRRLPEAGLWKTVTSRLCASRILLMAHLTKAAVRRVFRGTLVPGRNDGKTVHRLTVRAVGGDELAVRFRIAREGDSFRWKSGAKPCLYGLNRLNAAQARRFVVLVVNQTATRFGSTAFLRSGFQVPQIGARIVTRASSTVSR
jgi:hypothetical protein